jgi:hypothetical protein
MAYGVNSPFGLRPYGHLISGVNDIKTNSNYTIATTSLSLNKGDPVAYSVTGTDYNVVANGYQGQQSEIILYNPTVTLQAAGTATTSSTAVAQPIVGVFQGCSYYTPNGTYISQEYWQAGTATNGQPVMATIIDDPYVIWDIQLGTYMGSFITTPTQFLTLPCLQVQNGTWPNTGQVASNATIANSCVIGSNVALLTGRGPTGAVAGRSGSLSTITLNGIVQNYADNPLIANQGTANGNPWGVSTFYACPSITATAAIPSANDGRNEYSRNTTRELKVLGFTPDSRNVPGTYGQPGNGTAGTYLNTAFLNVLVVINNHANKIGTASVVIG